MNEEGLPATAAPCHYHHQHHRRRRHHHHHQYEYVLRLNSSDVGCLLLSGVVQMKLLSFFLFLDQKWWWWLWRWERIKGKAAALFPNRFPGGDLPHHALLSSAQPSYHLHHQLANSIINIAITIPILTMYSPSSPLFDGRWINSYLINYLNQLLPLLMAAQTTSNNFSRQMGSGPTVFVFIGHTTVPILISTSTNFFPVLPQDWEGTIGKKPFIAISVLVRSNQNIYKRFHKISLGREYSFKL